MTNLIPLHRFAIELLIMGNVDAAAKALLALWNLQTMKEKSIHLSVLKNWKGFNFPDSPSLSLYASLLKQGKDLTADQWADMQRRLCKYSKQLQALGIFWA